MYINTLALPLICLMMVAQPVKPQLFSSGRYGCFPHRVRVKLDDASPVLSIAPWREQVSDVGKLT